MFPVTPVSHYMVCIQLLTMNMSNGDVLKTYNIQMIMYMIILYVIYSRPLGILKVVLYGLFCVLPVRNIYIYEYHLPYAMVRIK